VVAAGRASYDGPMGHDDERWQPTAPSRPAAPWESRVGSGREPAAPGGPDRPDRPDPADAAPPAAPPRPSLVATALSSAGARAATAWRGRSRVGRLAVAGAALVVATALVTSLGVAARPRWAPLVTAAVAVDDLRSEPDATLWRTDLGDALGLDFSDRCTALDVAADLGADDVVVATASQGYGDGSPCGGTGGRLARLDTRTGEVRWTLDLGAELGVAVTTVRVEPSADGATALVVGDGQWARTSGTAARIDTSDGRVLDRLDASAAGATDRDLVQGTSSTEEGLLVTATDRDRFDTGGGLELGLADVDRVGLYAAGDLTRPVWSGSTVSATASWMVGGTLVAAVVDPAAARDDAARAVADAVWSTIDVGTGQVQPLPGDVQGVSSVEAWGDDLVVSRTVTDAGDSVVSLIDPVEGVVWSRDLPPQDAVRLSAGCLVVAGGSTTVTCVDPDTGRTRWSRELDDEGRRDGQGPEASWLGTAWSTVGAATGSVVVTTTPLQVDESQAGETDPLWLVDPASGETQLETTLPSGSQVVAASRTTAYAVRGWWTPSEPPAVTAFDLSDGRRLWSAAVGTTGSIAPFWRRTLVTVDDGVARGLGTDVRLPG